MGGPRASTSKARTAVAADVVTAAKAALNASATRRAANAEPVVLSAADRENPDKLNGDALRELAHRRGVSRSEAANMSDEKLRMQLRYITQRQYAEEE
jgi:hypothetical protein